MDFALRQLKKILFKLNKQSTKAMKRKIKIFHSWFKQHKMSAEDIIQSYQSWRAHAKHCNSYQILASMDNYFYKYFQPQIQYRKNKICSTIPLLKTSREWICQKEFYGIHHTSSL